MIEVNEEELDKLIESQEPISYSKLCKKLGLEYFTGGNQKAKQMSDLADICQYEKIGTKYVIKNRSTDNILVANGKETTLPNIRYILLSKLTQLKEYNNQYLDNDDDELKNILFMTNKELLLMCGMINQNFYDLLTNAGEENRLIALYYNFDFTQLLIYKDGAYNLLKSALKSALRSMVASKDILDETGYVVTYQKKRYNVLGSSKFGKELFKLQRQCLSEIGVESVKEFYTEENLRANKLKEYLDLCNQKAKEKTESDPKWKIHKWRADKFYQCHALVLNESTTTRKYTLIKTAEARESLNVKTIEKVNKSRNKKLRLLTIENRDKFVEACHTLDLNKTEYDFKKALKEALEIMNMYDMI